MVVGLWLSVGMVQVDVLLSHDREIQVILSESGMHQISQNRIFILLKYQVING